jgi:TM2 domain-containing membrane protein YozV
MSLRVLHLVFIVAATLLSLGLGGGLLWMYRSQGGVGLLIMGLVWWICGAALVIYGRAFLRKLRSLSRS